MPNLRDTISSRPWIGWTLAAVLIVGIVLAYGRTLMGGPSEVERLGQDVTVVCTETGEEWQMSRGRFEAMLLQQDGAIERSKGIPSPHADGRRTGVLANEQEWERTVERINMEKRSAGLIP